ncbi:hypothetical protein F5Y16DRAFT_395588 [Xylariaceae sp. FL0255]|nr:hypothetical protein F5Y16DRAFT_395588 [Xylariaceae sp. FL0255]
MNESRRPGDKTAYDSFPSFEWNMSQTSSSPNELDGQVTENAEKDKSSSSAPHLSCDVEQPAISPSENSHAAARSFSDSSSYTSTSQTDADPHPPNTNNPFYLHEDPLLPDLGTHPQGPDENWDTYFRRTWDQFVIDNPVYASWPGAHSDFSYTADPASTSTPSSSSTPISRLPPPGFSWVTEADEAATSSASLPSYPTDFNPNVDLNMDMGLNTNVGESAGKSPSSQRTSSSNNREVYTAAAFAAREAIAASEAQAEAERNTRLQPYYLHPMLWSALGVEVEESSSNNEENEPMLSVEPEPEPAVCPSSAPPEPPQPSQQPTYRIPHPWPRQDRGSRPVPFQPLTMRHGSSPLRQVTFLWEMPDPEPSSDEWTTSSSSSSSSSSSPSSWMSLVAPSSFPFSRPPGSLTDSSSSSSTTRIRVRLPPPTRSSTPGPDEDFSTTF